MTPSRPQKVDSYAFDRAINDLIINDDLIIAFSHYSNDFQILQTNLPSRPNDVPLIADSYRLYNNYPNPFNPETFIKFVLEKQSKVLLKVYNAGGQLVNTLADSNYEPGSYWIKWDGTNNSGFEVASGVYFYQLNVDGKASTKRMLLIK